MDGPTVRELLRVATTATLATLDAATGHPYASLVEVATMPDARPILLLSDLARHTRNLKADPRCSLLVDQRDTGTDPLATGRATLIGVLRASGDATARRRYLARHPKSEPFADFGDFGFWVMNIDRAHGIAGFGRIREVAGSDVGLTEDAAAAFAALEPVLLARINHRLAARSASRSKPLCIATGIDPEGVDYRMGSGLFRKSVDLRSRKIESYDEAIIYALTEGPSATT